MTKEVGTTESLSEQSLFKFVPDLFLEPPTFVVFINCCIHVTLVKSFFDLFERVILISSEMKMFEAIFVPSWFRALGVFSLSGQTII